ncbi:MAG: hypothetical protein WBD31_21500, partial [Rubripirellula sp.]
RGMSAAKQPTNQTVHPTWTRDSARGTSAAKQPTNQTGHPRGPATPLAGCRLQSSQQISKYTLRTESQGHKGIHPANGIAGRQGVIRNG